MKTKYSIEMDFTQAKQRAGELEEIASKMHSLAERSLTESFQTLSEAWRGEAALAYLEKGERLKEKILDTAGRIEKTAASIRRIAQRTYQAEMTAYRIALKRSYGEE